MQLFLKFIFAIPCLSTPMGTYAWNDHPSTWLADYQTFRAFVLGTWTVTNYKLQTWFQCSLGIFWRYYINQRIAQARTIGGKCRNKIVKHYNYSWNVTNYAIISIFIAAYACLAKEEIYRGNNEDKKSNV